ncbi:MAG: peptidoglycan DD-metalloendopeptidase family protein [bacterium]|nr:peptidoglycan DD-metalloendopeptidase family protein [bacterium]
MRKRFYAIFLITVLLGTAFPISAVALPAPEVFVSSASLVQADTLLVVVKNESAQISGKLGTVKMRFFRSENGMDWIAITGIPINKTPGNYTLAINIPGKLPFKKTIKVKKRVFSVTKMVITPNLSQKGFTPKKIVSTIENEENKTLNKVLANINPSAFFTKPFIYPLSEIKITGNYGDIRASGNYKIQHLGVDLRAPKNTPVYAVNDGIVVFSKSLPDYGNTLVIDHGLGVYSLYLHLADFNLYEGVAARQGDIIGLAGDTGYATAPHLHFSIKVRGSTVDPLRFINATRAE